MTEHERLDEILRVLSKDVTKKLTYEEIKEDLNWNRYKGFSLEILLVTLKKDKFINIESEIFETDIREEVTLYSLTIKGKLFAEKGGYRKKLKKDSIYETLQKTEIVVLIVGGSVGCYYALCQIYDFYHKCCRCH